MELDVEEDVIAHVDHGADRIGTSGCEQLEADLGDPEPGRELTGVASRLDEIVDVDLAETRRMSFDDGTEYVSRTVVVQTECRARYEGRRIWFGTESESVQWGLVFERADILEVADVRRVRDLFEDGSQFLDLSMVEIELLDGTVFETELFPLAGG